MVPSPKNSSKFQFPAQIPHSRIPLSKFMQKENNTSYSPFVHLVVSLPYNRERTVIKSTDVQKNAKFQNIYTPLFISIQTSSVETTLTLVTEVFYIEKQLLHPTVFQPPS